mgnify:FL=1
MSYEMWGVLAFGLVTVLLMAWLVVRRMPGTVEEARTALAQAAELAQVAVAAAEQLQRTGRLPDNDAKFQYALGLLAAEFPGLDVKQLTASVEAAVYWLRQAGQRAQQAG